MLSLHICALYATWHKYKVPLSLKLYMFALNRWSMRVEFHDYTLSQMQLKHHMASKKTLINFVTVIQNLGRKTITYASSQFRPNPRLWEDVWIEFLLPSMSVTIHDCCGRKWKEITVTLSSTVPSLQRWVPSASVWKADHRRARV